MRSPPKHTVSEMPAVEPAKHSCTLAGSPALQRPWHTQPISRGNSSSVSSSCCGTTTTRQTLPTGLQPEGMLSVTSACQASRAGMLNVMPADADHSRA